MIWPCPNKVDCPGSDFPLRNLSSEGPDNPMYSAVGFCCNGQQAWTYSLSSQENADDALQRLMFTNCPDCSEPRSYCADARCPDGSLIASYCVPTSQAEADTLAGIAEETLQPFCDGELDQLYSATCACPDGSDPITMYSAVSEADALAICQSVPRTCSTDHPYSNGGQSCTVRCPDGTYFTYTIAPNTYYASSQAEADALAYAVACERARLLRVCLSGSMPRCCLGSDYSTILTATSGREYTWTVTGLPAGFIATPVGDNGLLITGTGLVAGIYSVAVRAEDSLGNYMTKTYTLIVWGISDTSLPDATEGDIYSYQLTTVGLSAPYTYSLVTGGFPLGIALSSSGLIDGVAGEAGSFSPVIRVTDATGRTCTKAFTLISQPLTNNCASVEETGSEVLTDASTVLPNLNAANSVTTYRGKSVSFVGAKNDRISIACYGNNDGSGDSLIGVELTIQGYDAPSKTITVDPQDWGTMPTFNPVVTGGQSRFIVGNTANTIVLDSAYPIAPLVGDSVFVGFGWFTDTDWLVPHCNQVTIPVTGTYRLELGCEIDPPSEVETLDFMIECSPAEQVAAHGTLQFDEYTRVYLTYTGVLATAPGPGTLVMLGSDLIALGTTYGLDFVAKGYTPVLYYYTAIDMYLTASAGKYVGANTGNSVVDLQIWQTCGGWKIVPSGAELIRFYRAGAEAEGTYGLVFNSTAFPDWGDPITVTRLTA